MYTYVQRPGCKKENTATYVYIRAGSRTPTRAYVWPGLVYMDGSERRNSVVVVFMGSQPAGSEQNASSCSSGGLGRNSRWKQGLVYRRTEETALCSTGHVRNKILFIGRGLAYRKTEQMDFYGTSDGRNGVLLIGRGVAYRKTEETDLLRSKRGSCSSGGVWRTAKRDSTGYCSSPPSTSSSLHGLLFIQPSTPRVPVHPEATPPLTVHPNPPATLTVHPIDRLQLAAVAKESLDRVQLTAIDRSLGFSNA